MCFRSVIMNYSNNDSDRPVVELKRQNAFIIPSGKIEAMEDDRIEEELGKMIEQLIEEQEAQAEKEQHKNKHENK